MEKFVDNPEFLQDIFLEETWKNIDKIDNFIEEKAKGEEFFVSREEVDSLFRTMHSVKGSASMMGYPSISETAHSAEDLFSYLREEENPAQNDLKLILQLLRMVSGFLKRELRRMETDDEVTDFGWAVVRRIKNFLAHVDSDNEPEGPSYQISYTRKGKQIIPYTNFSTLIPQMERLANIMGRELSKEFVVKISGAETEVPRDIYEKISMAVMQMMKNSMDHGLESTIVRERMGKTPVGEISVEIQKAGQRIFVVFRDDGRGLDKHGILQTAREKGLLKKPEEDYEDNEIFSFLLRPGFTTKSRATMFSGRGVGLDVVNAAVSSLGGTVRIESREYMGTTFFMEFPVVA
ncbi:ATP-binding protein [Anaerotignum sp.]|uniref:ATP-binding protein n=1 Tax=Anaerotignum sp. TaxID=2039241 RepID=UPI002714E02F|nr:ATP-binding protein [Anaerotignum sp.]